jgi:hypothetical protein
MADIPVQYLSAAILAVNIAQLVVALVKKKGR